MNRLNFLNIFTVQYLNTIVTLLNLLTMKKTIKKKDEFKVLRVISSDPRKSQRNLANELGFSLGKLNYCIQALKKKGLIKINNFSKKKNKLDYIYLLTPKGIYHKTRMAYFFMKQIMKEYEDLKTETKKK